MVQFDAPAQAMALPALNGIFRIKLVEVFTALPAMVLRLGVLVLGFGFGLFGLGLLIGLTELLLFGVNLGLSLGVVLLSVAVLLDRRIDGIAAGFVLNHS